MSFSPPGECPVCGEEVPARAKGCTACGACPASGWSDETEDEGDGFDYETFVEEELGGKEPLRIDPGWVILAGIVLIAFVTRILNLW